MSKLDNSIYKVVEKHYKKIIIMLLILIIIVPILVWLFYSFLDIPVYTDISADGMLGYLGSIIAAFASLLVAIVAVWQVKRTIDAEKQLASAERRKTICPSIQIEVKELLEADGVFELTIHNTSNYAAEGIWLYEYAFLPFIKPNESKKKRFSLGTSAKGDLIVDESYCDITTDGYPEVITLIYSDIYKNTISQDFICTEAHIYEGKECEYC